MKYINSSALEDAPTGVIIALIFLAISLFSFVGAGMLVLYFLSPVITISVLITLAVFRVLYWIWRNK